MHVPPHVPSGSPLLTSNWIALLAAGRPLPSFNAYACAGAALQDMEHVLFVPTQRGHSMAAQLAAAQWLQEHDAAAQRMGRAARELLRKAPTPDLVLEYWRRLIVQYAALQVGAAWGGRVSSGAVPGEGRDSLMIHP